MLSKVDSLYIHTYIHKPTQLSLSNEHLLGLEQIKTRQGGTLIEVDSSKRLLYTALQDPTLRCFQDNVKLTVTKLIKTITPLI